MSDTSLIFNFLRGRDTASPHMRTVANNARGMSNAIKLSSIVSVAATTAMVAGFAGLAAQAVALVSAMGPLTGLLAYLPALGFAAVAGIIPLILAFHGLAAALKHTAGGAGPSSQAIVAGERRIEQAQRAATQAQQDLNAARQTAAEKLANITRELARAHLDEEGAVLAVADAQRTLREARMSGDRSSVQHANLGYRESVQSLIEVRARLADVAAEEQDRTQKGVEGSDEVQTALQRQADALQNLADAQAALKTSGGGGGIDKAAEAYAKLSMAGKQLVDVLRSLAPAWKGVQTAVQQSVFAGVAGDVRKLSTAYLPVMAAQLPAIGQGWNNAFRGTAQLATTAGFVADMNTSLMNTATFWQRVGSSFAPFLSGFRQFMVVGSTFLPGFGQWVLDIGNRFDRWATAARTSGKAHDWIQNALTTLGQFWQIIKNLGSSIVSIFKAGSGGPDWLPGLVAGTATLSAWLASPVGQGQLAAVFTTLRDVGSQMWAILTNLIPTLLGLFSAGGTVSDTFTVFNVVIGFAADHIGELAAWLPTIIALFIAWRVAQASAIALDIIRIPLIIAQTVSNFALAGAMRASMVATEAQTVATWALNTAWLANPITWIILAIVALIVIIVLIATKTKWFQTIWRVAWTWVKTAAKNTWEWLKKVPGWIGDAFKKIGNYIAYPFIWAFNWVIRAYNNTLGKLNFDLPSWLGGGHIGFPQAMEMALPKLATGGFIERTGVALVHKGEMVTPAGRSRGETTLRLVGDDSKMIDLLFYLIRKGVRARGGDVQLALGGG